MRIRPAVVTGSASIIAWSAVAVIILATTPSDASAGIVRLLWTALFLAVWGLFATLILVAQQSVAQAVWTGLWPSVAVICVLLARRAGPISLRLLLVTVLATLGISVFTWWRFRRIPS